MTDTEDAGAPRQARHQTRAASPLSLSLPIDDIERDIDNQTSASAADEAKASADATQDPEDPELAATADRFAADVLAMDENEAATAHAQREAVDGMGAEVQRQAAHRSAMLQTPIRQLAQHGEDGGPVAKALTDLRGRMSDLDPQRHKIKDSALARRLSFIPGVGDRLQRYFQKFETAQEAIDAIIRDLEAGKDMLRRDNVTLADDQDAMRRLLDQLSRQIALGQGIDRRLQGACDGLDAESPKRRFIEEELIFPLRQRVVDLQQQLAVSQQGVLALEVVIRNNRELMRGVDRALNVTVSALNVAVTVALALANQRLVLDRVESLNKTTSDMIAGTASQLRSQGVDIQNRSASAMLDMEQLESAFADVLGAIDEVSRYRREALPKLSEQITRLETMAQKGERAIADMDRGNAAADEQDHAV
ncbi:toxic anion resistance protein [uncultured Salinisphaera sp.]|uniref:toxic anion resistance protein n=1 Tax=uncultured Salinisphaera sp. TaxID=359372 RepID=UPI0032B16CA7|tara:strand:+ start:1917 stop:3179 length:1263 start_codon:yes stop_codon:yes gene_type:complete